MASVSAFLLVFGKGDRLVLTEKSCRHYRERRPVLRHQRGGEGAARSSSRKSKNVPTAASRKGEPEVRNWCRNQNGERTETRPVSLSARWVAQATTQAESEKPQAPAKAQGEPEAPNAPIAAPAAPSAGCYGTFPGINGEWLPGLPYALRRARADAACTDLGGSAQLPNKPPSASKPEPKLSRNSAANAAAAAPKPGTKPSHDHYRRRIPERRVYPCAHQ